jgi:hypothetical protein
VKCDFLPQIFIGLHGDVSILYIKGAALPAQPAHLGHRKIHGRTISTVIILAFGFRVLQMSPKMF